MTRVTATGTATATGLTMAAEAEAGTDSSPAGIAPRGSAVSARLRIIAWILLTTTLGYAAVIVTIRSSLLAEVAREVNADVEQEANEVLEFARLGRDPETAQPFTSTARLLEVYLSRQYPGDGEDLVGYLPQSSEFLRFDRGADADDRLPYDLTGEGAELARRLLGSAEQSGFIQTPAGEMRWGRVDLTTAQPGDPGGSLLIAEFPRAAKQAVDSTIRLVLFVSLGGLVFTAGIAWLIAGQILSPIRTIRRAAATITERDLTQRIPVRGRDDIAALATTFNGMLDRLEDAFGGQQKFVDDASHELRTPITIIRGHLELMGDDPLDREATVGLLTTELDRMNRIVSDLLVLARAERPDFVRTSVVDVADLTLAIDAKMQTLADRRWTLMQVGDGRARVDAQRITQAVLQLAQNAVQHTQDGAEIWFGSQFRGGEVAFWITDSGPGVEPDEAETIFERFAQGSASVREGDRPGAGLGLAIVRAIADGHGGSAYVESIPGRGATFGIEVPVGHLGPARDWDEPGRAPGEPGELVAAGAQRPQDAS